jgi:hypothetical protein
MLTVNLNVNSAVTPSALSVNGGQVTITGTGLPALWPNTYFNNFQLSINGATKKVIALSVASTSTTTMVVNVPAGASGTVYTLIITSPINNLPKSVTFGQILTSTPTVNLTSTNPATAGTVAISLNRTVMSTVVP